MMRSILSFRHIETSIGSSQTRKLIRSRLLAYTSLAYRLSQITSSQINITIAHDRRGNITRIVHNPGGAIILQWSDEKDARLLNATDSSGGRVSFRQDGRRLRAMIDSANAQWEYDYAGGKLKRAADPLGRTLLRVRYDSAGHVIEAGDAVGVYRYDYNFTSASVSQRTVVTDAMTAGAATNLVSSLSSCNSTALQRLTDTARNCNSRPIICLWPF